MLIKRPLNIFCSSQRLLVINTMEDHLPYTKNKHSWKKKSKIQLVSTCASSLLNNTAIITFLNFKRKERDHFLSISQKQLGREKGRCSTLVSLGIAHF